jgi:UDP-N-acetyl-2-amino-2-deoxyglucuronate dehydrogenase
MKDKRKLNIGIIGCGKIAETHVAVLKKDKRINLMAFCDIIETKAIKLSNKFNSKHYINYLDLLKNRNIDVVHICTPHYLHSKMTIDSLNMKKHVLVEKPMALSLRDAKEMIKTAKENNKKLGVVLQHRFDSKLNFLLENLSYLGKLQSLNSTLLCNRETEYYSGWRGKPECGDSLLLNQYIHFMDIISLICGEEEIIKGFKENFENKSIIEDNVTLSIKFNKKILANIQISSNSIYEFNYNISINGDKGSCFLTEDRINIFYINDKGSKKVKKLKERNKLKRVLQIGKNYYGLGHIRLIDNFITSILNDKKPKVSGEDALQSLKLSLNCYNKIK